jgi:hypothetical protein
MDIKIPSSDPQALHEAIRIAEKFAKRFERDDIVGIVFLGAIVRGYYDKSSDIDIGFFTRTPTRPELPRLLDHVEGYAVHSWVADYDAEMSSSWDMGKRWTYSQGKVSWDPSGCIARLIQEKVPMTPAEKRQLIVSGAALSGWYIKELTETWIQRGSILSANCMFHEGLNHFYNMLYGLNSALVPSEKWKAFYAEKLKILPDRFTEKLSDVLLTLEISEAELRRRIDAFDRIWKPMVALVEIEVGMKYEEFKDTV